MNRVYNYTCPLHTTVLVLLMCCFLLKFRYIIINMPSLTSENLVLYRISTRSCFLNMATMSSLDADSIRGVKGVSKLLVDSASDSASDLSLGPGLARGKDSLRSTCLLGVSMFAEFCWLGVFDGVLVSSLPFLESWALPVWDNSSKDCQARCITT